MSFVFIGGPMKSGKSLELISRVAPYEFAGRRVIYVQPKVNVRDEGVSSRVGINVKSLSVNSLSEIMNAFDVIGVDEINMFPKSDAKLVETWISQGKDVFISGLNLDYKADIPEVVEEILGLAPDEIIIKKAVCDVCNEYSAAFTQILRNNKEVLGGISNIAPEDGTYEYEARCRKCFKKILNFFVKD